MGDVILEETTVKIIKLGHYEDFKWWFDDCSKADPNFDINKVVDARTDAEVNLKSYVLQDQMTALSYAAFYGSLKIVDFLLKKGADPTVGNVIKGNALHCAVCYDGEEHSMVEIVERLLKDSRMINSIDAQTTGHWTPLLSAVIMDRPDTVKILLENGADPSPVFQTPPTGLRHSLALAACNDGKVLAQLLKQEKMRKPEEVNKQVGESRYTPLHYALLYVNVESISSLVGVHADVTVVDATGNCPIHFATEARNNVEFERIVSDLRGSINDQDSDGCTLLHLLVKANMTEYVKILRSSGFNADYKVVDNQGRYPLHYLSRHRDNEELVHLLADRYIIKAKDYKGYNALHFAAKELDYKLIHVLLRAQARELRADIKSPERGRNGMHLAAVTKGSDEDFKKLMATFQYNLGESEFVRLVNEGDDDSKTPLHLALETGMHTKVEILLEHFGADPRVKTSDTYGSQHLIHLAVATEGTDMQLRSVLTHVESRLTKDEFTDMINAKDGRQKTALQVAVERKKFSRVEILLDFRADPGIPPPQQPRGEPTLVHLATLSEGRDVEFRTIIRKIEDIFSEEWKDVVNALDKNGKTALHLAMENMYFSRVETLLEFGADPGISAPVTEQTILHLATISKGSDDEFERIVNKVPQSVMNGIINAQDLSGNTALHLALRTSQWSRAEKILKLDPDSSIRDKRRQNCLHVAFEHNAPRSIVGKLLLKACRGDMDEDEDLDSKTPLQHLNVDSDAAAVMALERAHNTTNTNEKPLNLAIRIKKLEIVKVLLVKGADLDVETLHKAISEGDEKLVMILVRHSHNLLSVLRSEKPNEQSTTNFNELVKSMPDVAREVLDRSVSVAKEEVEFDYSFIDKDYTDPCALNPLQVMVDNESTDLLQHPVIRSYLYIQWNHLGFWFFMLFLVLYGCFLILLSLFSLSVNHPLTDTCTNSTGIADCGPFGRLVLTFMLGALVTLFAILLLINEVFRLKYYLSTEYTRWDYFKHFQNWNELFLFPLSIIFVLTFPNNCGCPTVWQWQVGIFAVFLAWMNLLYIAAEFPKTGTYIIVFKEILVTFLKLTSFSLILVVGFALILMMMFSNPEAEISSFSHIGYSFVRTMTMVTGEMDFDGLFHLGVPPSAYTPIPFHITNFIMWIIFLVLIPIVLGNMLTSLAVGDTNEVIENAGLQKLKLQVKTVLKARATAWEPVKRWFLKDVFNLPNKKRKFIFNEFEHFWTWSRLQLFIWGGEEFVSAVKTDEYERCRKKERSNLKDRSSVQTDLQHTYEGYVVKRLDQLLETVEANENSIRKLLK